MFLLVQYWCSNSWPMDDNLLLRPPTPRSGDKVLSLWLGATCHLPSYSPLPTLCGGSSLHHLHWPQTTDIRHLNCQLWQVDTMTNSSPLFHIRIHQWYPSYRWEGQCCHWCPVPHSQVLSSYPYIGLYWTRRSSKCRPGDPSSTHCYHISEASRYHTPRISSFDPLWYVTGFPSSSFAHLPLSQSFRHPAFFSHPGSRPTKRLITARYV